MMILNLWEQGAVLNTEVKSPSQIIILGSQGQTIISKNIHIEKNNKTFIIFKVWVGSGGFYGKYSITEKYVLIGPVSILWIHTEDHHQQHKLAARVKKLDAS